MSRVTSRRAALATGGAALAALAGCTKYGDESQQPEPPPSSAPASGTSKPAGGGGGSGGGGGGAPALTKTADIPVGGGKIFADKKVVVTQPEAGSFKAFSAICTHQGCTVSSVSGGTINCPCHGSKYRVADASVAGGPAPRPLAPQAIKVTGDSISLA
ncbi:Rieske (2Fe-2S) protein [Streptomyces beijiangensis]|uniref:Cytochrome bc1 complex Rieske iron-sulfur subunit n=1 Tax=Streptomyces beijiangensis TaxID=163361 RepID=A0A939FC64_9ACTN|nr:Rieske (2Fe-2S) protein [Streptomyces beijiangensis]MBO0516370.1 Rieske (2Fe-2S) protein [Streptomyces beijiangensis]